MGAMIMKRASTLDTVRGGSHRYRIDYDELQELFADVFNSAAFSNLRLDASHKEVDRVYGDNSTFWDDSMQKRHHEGMRVELDGFYLAEWASYSPGRFFTARASHRRKWAERFWDDNREEYRPGGKQDMVLGGVGTVRRVARMVESAPLYIMGAS
jgi:hypothetical protein